MLCWLHPALGMEFRRFPAGHVRNPGLVACARRAMRPPCTWCNRTNLRKALTGCYPLQSANFVKDSRGAMSVVFEPGAEAKFGLGNHLGQYFHNAGMARVAKIGFHVTAPFNISGFVLPSGPLVPPQNPVDFTGVSMVRYYCKICNKMEIFEWPHTCPGPWLREDIKGHLHRAIRHSGVRFEERQVVIQFRCSDTYYRDGYGMLSWMFYHESLQDVTRLMGNASFPITIIRDPKAEEEAFCRVMLRVLVRTIRHVFRCDVEVRAAHSLLEDVAMMIHAKAFLSSVSSLGVFVGAACNGVAYLPVSEQGVRYRAPCLGHIRWLRSYFWGGKRDARKEPRAAIGRIPQWFAPKQRPLISRFVREIVEADTTAKPGTY